MTQPNNIPTPAVGACLPCRQLFLVIPEAPNCILCGQPPAYTVPLSQIPPFPPEPAPGEPVEPIPSAVPQEELSPAAEVPPPAAGEEPPEEAPETIKDTELLTVVIAAFLVGDVAVDEEQLKGIFEDVGAEAEAAATAVGRLSAVRELLEDLRGQGVAVTVETSEAPAGNSPG